MKREHRPYRLLAASLSLSVLVLVGCELVDSGNVPRAGRTYPQALDLPAVQLVEALQPTDTLRRVNIEVVVLDRSQCPENARCALENHIFVTDQLFHDPASIGAMIPVDQANQFEVDAWYRMSIEVDLIGARIRKLRLLGYD